MRNRGLLVEVASHAMPYEFMHHAEPASGCFVENCIANVGNTAAGRESMNSKIETIECALCNGPCDVGNLANQKCFRGIAVPSFDDRCHIDVDDVTLDQCVVSRNAVTNDIV